MSTHGHVYKAALPPIVYYVNTQARISGRPSETIVRKGRQAKEKRSFLL